MSSDQRETHTPSFIHSEVIEFSTHDLNSIENLGMFAQILLHFWDTNLSRIYWLRSSNNEVIKYCYYLKKTYFLFIYSGNM